MTPSTRPHTRRGGAPPADADAALSTLASVYAALATDSGAGRFLLASLVAVLPTAAKRANLTRPKQLQVFRRDSFTCRYCGRRTLLLAALQYLSSLYPDLLPYHPNWKRTATHPLYPDVSASCDHVTPVALGGTSDLSNLVTACARCQYMKRDWTPEDLAWSLRPPQHSDWDGLSHAFAFAFSRHPTSDANLRRWADALAR